MALDGMRSAEFLREIAHTQEQVRALGRGVCAEFEGTLYFLARNWIVAGWWDRGGFGYLSLLIAPQGEVGHYAAWFNEDAIPEDLLSPHEFAWLWGLLERAPVIPWTTDLKDRARAAYRYVHRCAQNAPGDISLLPLRGELLLRARYGRMR